jgi:lysophospholipase L1-like esterase
MYRRILLVVVTSLAAAAAAMPAAASASAAKRHYYVALGDSLSQGMQPNIDGVTENTKEGYVNDLFATERGRIRNLKLVDLGCYGETSASMLTGKGNPGAALYHCRPAGGSQLAAAVRFLRAHHARGEVPLVTVDIGANDVDRCAQAADIGTCVNDGTNSIDTNVPKILSALRRAAPAGTTFAFMNLYDPLLAGYFSPSGHNLAMATPALAQEVNGKLAAVAAAAHFKLADVAAAFDTYDSTTMVTWENQQIPVNVARVCAYTWACQTPPTGPNIHANRDGYAVIAAAFEKVIGKL